MKRIDRVLNLLASKHNMLIELSDVYDKYHDDIRGKQTYARAKEIKWCIDLLSDEEYLAEYEQSDFGRLSRFHNKEE